MMQDGKKPFLGRMVVFKKLKDFPNNWIILFGQSSYGLINKIRVVYFKRANAIKMGSSEDSTSNNYYVS